jgi:hypothetical protein
MSHFFRLLAVCLGITLLSCIGAVMVGRAQPQPQLSPNVRRCAGIPCYMDIVLGQTTWPEAQTIINATPGWNLYAGSHSAFEVNQPIDHVYSMYVFPAANDLVQEIDLAVTPATVTAGDVIAQLGKPCAVISRGLSDLSFTYPGIAVSVSGQQWRIQANSTVKEIRIYVPMYPCDRLAAYATSYRWHGFREYRK